MPEDKIKRDERTLFNKTLSKLEKESFYCALANGKLANIATAVAIDKGAFKIVKAVYDKINKDDLDKLLSFNEAPAAMPCIIEIWFWHEREREPFFRKKLFFNQPTQDIDNISNLVK